VSLQAPWYREVNLAEMRSTSVDDQTRAIERWAAYWSAHDTEQLLPLFTEDVIYEDVPMGVMNRGIAELRTFAEGVFLRFPDVTFELLCSFADGTRGGAEWVMRGARDLPGMPATGKRVEVRGASIFEFVGHKIRRCSDYWDMATYLKQVGLMLSA
jgi:steroid delta-isomerase-like uncharacterized protein